MPKFFISYRRADSLDIVGRIYDRLAGHFGHDEVFLDVDTIPFGVDFRTYLTDWVSGCDGVIVVIGSRWLDCRFENGPMAGQRRLDDPADFVRIEVATALARDIPVIPVLVGGSSMPGPDQLPPDLSGLAFRNAAEVRSGRDFHLHMDRLIRWLGRPPKPVPPPEPKAQRKPERIQPSRREAPPRAEEAGGAVPAASVSTPEAPVEALPLDVDPPGRELTNSIGMSLVSIPAGEFAMGSPDEDSGDSLDEKPQHRVWISTRFYLSRFMDRLIRWLEEVGCAVPATSVSTPEAPGEALPPDVDPPGRELTNSIGMSLVSIPAGEFAMGSPDEDSGDSLDEKPQHRVWISTRFYLSRFQVTQDQYQQVMGDNPSFFKGDGCLPVEMISWFDAIAFCNRLSEREKLAPYYKVAGQEVTIAGGQGYRLPTEAEWEYACRAGSTTRYGYEDEATKLGDYAWYDDNSKVIGSRQTHRVGQKRPNAWGLHDMHGNIWEWCWDWYAPNFYNQSLDKDPAGPATGSIRVLRGGSFNDSASNLRSAIRYRNRPTNRNSDFGVRPARTYTESG
jgi:formylglycine-generating enzyme required for sulfatase activity